MQIPEPEEQATAEFFERLKSGDTVEIVTSPYSNVSAGQRGVIESEEQEGFAVRFENLTHPSAGGGKRKPVPVTTYYFVAHQIKKPK